MVLNKTQQVEAIGKTKTHHAYLFPCLRECTSLPPTMLESKYHTRPYCSPSHPDYLHKKTNNNHVRTKAREAPLH